MENKILEGIYIGIGASIIWSICCFLFNLIKSLTIALNIRICLWKTDLVYWAVGSRVGIVIKNRIPWDFTIRDVTIISTIGTHQLAYDGDLKPEYSQYITLRPRMEGKWCLIKRPDNIINFADIKSVLITVEYKYLFGMRRVVKFRTSRKYAERLAKAVQDKSLIVSNKLIKSDAK